MQGFEGISIQMQAPPPGRYLSTIVEAEATFSKQKADGSGGHPMIHLKVRIEDERYAGQLADDYIITVGRGADGKPLKGAGLWKKKLLDIGTPLILQNIEGGGNVPDNVIVQELNGLQLFVEYGNEQKYGRSDPNDPSGAFDKPMTITDDNGREVPLNKLTVKGYSRNAVGHKAAPAPQAQAAAPQAQPAYAPQAQAPQFAPQPQQGFAPQPVPQQGFAPQPGFPAPAPGFAPQQPQQGYAPAPGQPQFAYAAPAGAVAQQPQQAAAPGVAQAQAPWNGQQPAVPPPAAKKPRKMQVTGQDPNEGP